MTLPRDTVTSGMLAEYQSFADLLRSLSPGEWELPTRCEGWRVADVAAHVSGIFDDVVHLRLDGIGSPEAGERQVDDRRSFGPGELADELERNIKLGADLANGFDDATWNGPPLAAGLVHTVGFGVEGLWYDTFVHGDDIRVAARRERARPTQSLNAAVSHLAQLLEDKGWGPATLALDGVDTFAVGDGGRRVTGDPLDFVLVATGRADASTLGLDPDVNVYG